MRTRQASVPVHGRALGQVRRRMGISTTALASRVGCDRTTIANIERGHRYPSPELWARICAELGMPQSELMLPMPGSPSWEMLMRAAQRVAA